MAQLELGIAAMEVVEPCCRQAEPPQAVRDCQTVATQMQLARCRALATVLLQSVGCGPHSVASHPTGAKCSFNMLIYKKITNE